MPAVGFSIGFERLVDLLEVSATDAAASLVLIHDADVALPELLTLKAALVADGTRVRLERRTKNVKALLERAMADGFTGFASVTAGTTVDTLEVRPLA